MPSADVPPGLAGDPPPDDLIARGARPRRAWPRIALVSVLAAMLAALALGPVLSAAGDETPSGAPTTPSTRRATTTLPPTTTVAPTTTTTIPPLAQPAVQPLPPPPGGSVRQGARGEEVRAYEARLAELRFDPGPVDGVFDDKTRMAVEAVDKLLGWERDGVIDQAWVDIVANFRYPDPHLPAGEPDRVELDLDRQVLIVYRGWQVALVTATSTGSGKRFCGGDDGCQYAVTPAGRYEFTRHIDGWRTSKLGRLYRPWYFNGGIAVHGYPSVPTKPASHGCARVPMHVAEYFGILAFHGMPVYVLGEQAPRGGYPAGHPNGGSARTTAPSRPSTPAPAPAPAPPPEPDPTPAPTTTTAPAPTTTATPAPTTTAAPSTTAAPATTTTVGGTSEP